MMQFALVLLLPLAAALTLTSPNVNLDTTYNVWYDATLGRNVTAYEVYRINQVLAWGLPGDNSASIAGDVGFVIQEYGQTSGYILRYCVEMLMPQGTGYEELQHGGTDAFASYECCGSGSCSNCGYTGSGTSQVPNMVGRSYNLDVPSWTQMSKAMGWWYSFPAAGDCGKNDLNTNGCVYRTSPYVDVVKLQDFNTLNGWTTTPANMAEFQVLGNMMGNAFNSPLMNAFYYNSTENKYHPLGGRIRADPNLKCAVPCPMGSYSASGMLQPFATTNTCTQCPVGSYSDTPGAKGCKACPYGETTNAPGAQSFQDCYPTTAAICAAGTYSYTGHSPCTPCAAGTFQNLQGQTECNTCPEFTASTTVGASSAAACVLQPPQAFFVYEYAASSSALTGLSNQIGADAAGEYAFLQSDNYGDTISTSGAVTRRCVESVNEFAPKQQYPCWGTYCNYASTNPQNLVVNGPGGVDGYNATSMSYNPLGTWYYFPKAGECSTTQQPGEGGCTWKSATLFESVSMNVLTNLSMSTCATNTAGYCYNYPTSQQVEAAVEIFGNFSDYATQVSTATVLSSSTIVGPVTIENGRCTVQCPTGYTFRSAFTTPYCIPSGSSTLYASATDGEEAVDLGTNKDRAIIIGVSVSAGVAFMGLVVFVALRVYKSRHASLLGSSTEMN